MSATRNPFYQLPGGADLPGDVRVSDTADASKTAAGGWAASPAAVANAELTSKPNYNVKTKLGGTGTYTINQNGFVQFHASCGSVTAQIFHRIKINGLVVDEGYTENRNYNYYMSALFPVDVGDVVETIGGTGNVNYDTYFLSSRN